MKRFLLLIIVCLLATGVYAESISDGGAGSTTTLHNDLLGLNSGNYWHLTWTDKYIAMNGADTVDHVARHYDAYTASFTLGFEATNSVFHGTFDLTDATIIGLGSASVPVHNGLAGLNDGEYKHLTAAELTELQYMDSNYVATSSLVTILMGYAALNGNVAEDFAADHLAAVTASFTGDVGVGGDLTVGATEDMAVVGNGSGAVTVTADSIQVDADVTMTGEVDLSGATVIGLPATNYFGFDPTLGQIIGYNIAGGFSAVTPAQIGGVNVAMIASYAFLYDNIGTIDMSASPITLIGRMAFEECRMLASVVFPSTLVEIGAGAFYNCAALINPTFPSSLVAIRDNAFFACAAFTNLVLPNSVVTVEDRAFYACNKITSLVLSNTLQTIGSEAFKSNLLASVTLPNTLTTIGAYAFESTKLTSIVIPSSVVTIGTGAFRNITTMAEATVTNQIVSLMFQNDPIVKITIGAGATIVSDASCGTNGTGFIAAYTSGGAGTYNWASGWTKE